MIKCIMKHSAFEQNTIKTPKEEDNVIICKHQMEIEIHFEKLRGSCVSLELEDGKVTRSSIVNSYSNFLKTS